MGYLSGPDWTLETPKKYILVGAHRSGTSFIADSLRRNGVEFATGGWRAENRAFYGINKQIINDAGGIWMYPPAAEDLLIAGQAYAPQIQAVIKDFNSRAPLWGCKDPRMSLTLRSWLDFLDGDVYLIAIFRRPEAVAASIDRKQLFPYQDAYDMAQEYTRRIILAVKEFMGV